MAGRLTGKRILIVEDEYLTAADLKRALEAEAATVVGPVGQLERGLALIGSEAVDAAVLDVNLGRATTYPIADRLRGSATPWLFVTGYDGWAMPEAYRDAPRIAKPFAMRAVIDAIVAMIAGSAGP